MIMDYEISACLYINDANKCVVYHIYHSVLVHFNYSKIKSV